MENLVPILGMFNLDNCMEIKKTIEKNKEEGDKVKRGGGKRELS